VGGWDGGERPPSTFSHTGLGFGSLAVRTAGPPAQSRPRARSDRLPAHHRPQLRPPRGDGRDGLDWTGPPPLRRAQVISAAQAATALGRRGRGTPSPHRSRRSPPSRRPARPVLRTWQVGDHQHAGR
jgi:hypothetical protein